MLKDSKGFLFAAALLLTIFRYLDAFWNVHAVLTFYLAQSSDAGQSGVWVPKSNVRFNIQWGKYLQRIIRCIKPI